MLLLLQIQGQPSLAQRRPQCSLTDVRTWGEGAATCLPPAHAGPSLMLTLSTCSARHGFLHSLLPAFKRGLYWTPP